MILHKSALIYVTKAWEKTFNKAVMEKLNEKNSALVLQSWKLRYSEYCNYWTT